MNFDYDHKTDNNYYYFSCSAYSRNTLKVVCFAHSKLFFEAQGQCQISPDVKDCNPVNPTN